MTNSPHLDSAVISRQRLVEKASRSNLCRWHSGSSEECRFYVFLLHYVWQYSAGRKENRET